MKNTSTSSNKGLKLVMRVRVRQRLSRRMLILGSGICMAIVAVVLVIYFQTVKVEIAHAQNSGGDSLLSNTVASGGDISGSGLKVSYSIGQVDYITVSGNGSTATEGVQQPYEIYVMKGHEVADINVSVYPNPTAGFITLNINGGEDLQNMSFTVYDRIGQLVMQQAISKRQTGIYLKNFSSAMYILQVFKNNNEVKTFKIISYR